MKITKTQNPAPFPELRGTIESVRFPAFVEPKRDGEYCFCNISNGKAFLINKYGTARHDCGMTYQMETFFKDRQFQVLGELCYCWGMKGDLYNLLSNKTNESVLKFFIFDIRSLDGNNVCHLPLIDRKEMLLDLFDGFNSSSVIINPTILVTNNDELQEAYKKCLAGKFEGSVVKSLDSQLTFGPCSWVKIKEKDQSDFKVLSIDPVKERIEFEVKTMHGIRNVGVKVSHKAKSVLSPGMMVTIEHQGILNGGGLRHPVYIGVAPMQVQQIGEVQ